MRTNLLEFLYDVLLDPSFIELITSGPTISTKDFMIGLVWIVTSGLVTKLAVALIAPPLRRMLGRWGQGMAAVLGA